MLTMSRALAAFLLIICFLAANCHARTQFRFAIGMISLNWDFGWTFHLNIARINLQQHLTSKYPTITTEHSFALIPQSWSEECDPQFTAWVQQGYHLIFGVLGHAWCLSRLATLYSNVTFITLAGPAAGPPNYANLWCRYYQNAYLIGYTAGLMPNVKKVCVSAGVRAPAPVMDVSGFCRGVHNANPSAEVHILETGMLQDPLREVWNVNQSYAMGCDIVFVSSLAIDGCIQADKLGLKSIGWFTDSRLTVGESVIISAYMDQTPMLIRATEALLNSTFANETAKPDWWMGWEWGAMVLAQPSFLVPANVSARVSAQIANVNRVFCGRVCTKAGCLCNTSDCCVTDAQLNTLVSYPDFAIEHGIMPLPGLVCKAGQLGTWHIDTFTMTCTDCPAGTYAYNADQVSECRPCPAATYSLPAATTCTACPAGTYNSQPGQGQCPRCPAGAIAANPGAANCNDCPSGLTNSDGTACASASLVWLAGVGGGVGAILIFVGIWAWWASRKMRKLRKQFSNDHVAVECAAAIARLDLQAVAWLSDIPKPNCIQLSFIRIVQILDEVRKYIPDQLLQALAAGKGSTTESDGEEDAKSADALSLTSTSKALGSHSSKLLAAPVTSQTHPGSRPPSASSQTRRTSQRRQISVANSGPLEAGPRLFLVKKVTYMLVCFNVRQHEAPAGHAEHNMRVVLSHLVDAVKAHGGTVANVLYDHVVVHWGTGRRAVAEAPTQAVEAAMGIASFSGRLQGGAELGLNIAIGCGNAMTGVVETASNHFFVVGGGPVPLVHRVAAKNWRAALGVEILITDAVRASTQYSFVCHPRLLDGEDILWEPITRKKEAGVDEWMYQLQEGEEQTTAHANTLLAPFAAARKGDFAAAQSLVRDLRQHCKDLQPADLAALDLLASNAAACTNRSL